MCNPNRPNWSGAVVDLTYNSLINIRDRLRPAPIENPQFSAPSSAQDFIAAGDFVGLVDDFKRRRGIKDKPKKARPAARPGPIHEFAGLRPRVSSFSEITRDMTGLLVEPDQFLASKERREHLHNQTVFIASILEKNGVPAYRKQNKDDSTITLLGLLSGVSRTLDGKRFRNLNILPEPSQRARNERSQYLESFLSAHPHGKEARYHVQTFGQRFRVTDPFITARRRAIRRLISKELVGILASLHHVDLVFAGQESPVALADFGEDEGYVTVHDHMNLLLVPRRANVDWRAVEWCIIDFYSRKKLPGDEELTARHSARATIAREELDGRNRPISIYKRHGKLSEEPVRNPRELCKYICKNEDIIALALHNEADFMQYFRDLQAVKTFSFYGKLQGFRSSIKEENCRPALDAKRKVAIIKKVQVCADEVTRQREEAALRREAMPPFRYDSVNDCIMGEHERTHQEQMDDEERRRRALDMLSNRWVGTMLPCPMFFNMFEPVAIVQGYDPDRRNADPEDLGRQGYEGLQGIIAETRTATAERLEQQGVVLPEPAEMQAAYDRGRVIIGSWETEENTYVHNTPDNCPLTGSRGGVPGMADDIDPPTLPRYGVSAGQTIWQNTETKPAKRHRKQSRGGKRRRDRRNASNVMPRRAAAYPSV